MKPSSRLFLLLFIVLTLTACQLLPTVEPAPTLIPEEYIPTAIALTAEALAPENLPPVDTVPPPSPERGGGEPSFTVTPSREAPTLTPPPTQTASDPPPSPTVTYALQNSTEIELPASLPYGEIQILNPGPLSRVVSPIKLHAYLHPGDDDRVRIALYGEDGRLLVRHVLRYSAPPTYKVHLKQDLEFEIPGVAEEGRIEITTQDEFGRVKALTSADVILLSEGAKDINPPADLYEQIILQQPVASTLIQDGVIIVQGFTRQAPQGQLYVELVNFRGGVVGSKIIGVADRELERGYRFFVGEIPYQVGTPSWIRVQVMARDNTMSEVKHLSSVRILVSP